MGANSIIKERGKIFKEVLTKLTNEMLEEIEEFEKKEYTVILDDKFPNYEIRKRLEELIIQTRNKYYNLSNEIIVKEKVKEFYKANDDEWIKKPIKEYPELIDCFFCCEIDCKITIESPFYFSYFNKDCYCSIKTIGLDLKLFKNKEEIFSKTFEEILEIYKKNYINIYYTENNRHKTIKNIKKFEEKVQNFLEDYFVEKETKKIFEYFGDFFIEVRKEAKKINDDIEIGKNFFVAIKDIKKSDIIKSVSKKFLVKEHLED